MYEITIWVVDEAVDGLVDIATKDVIGTFDSGRCLVSDVVEERFSFTILNDHISHVFGNEIVHVLAPEPVDIIITHVPGLSSVKSVRFFELTIPHYLLCVLI